MRSSLPPILAFLLFPAFKTAPPEKPLTVSEVLRNVQKDKQWQSSQQMVEFANRLNYKLPVMREIGLRFGADDFNDASLRYGLAFSFNTAEQRRWQGVGNKAMTSFYASQREVIFNKEMTDCYRNIADFYCSSQQLDKNRQLDSLLELRGKALKLALENGLQVRARDLVETEDDQRDAQLAAQQTGNRMAEAKKRLSFLVGNLPPGDFRLVFGEMIGVDKIESVVAAFKTGTAAKGMTPQQRAAESEIILEKLNLKIAEAENRQWFDGFQVIHQVKQNPKLGEGISFRVGLDIPIRGNFNPKRNKILLDIKTAENQFELLTHEENKDIRAQLQKVEGKIAELRLTNERLASSLALKVLNSQTMLASMTATDVVDLRIIQKKKELEILKIYESLLQEYLILLEMNGNLVAPPLKNYLDEGLRLI